MLGLCLHLESFSPTLIDLGRSSQPSCRAACLWGLFKCGPVASSETKASDAAPPCWATKTPSGELVCKVRASEKRLGETDTISGAPTVSTSHIVPVHGRLGAGGRLARLQHDKGSIWTCGGPRPRYYCPEHYNSVRGCDDGRSPMRPIGLPWPYHINKNASSKS